MVKAKLRRKAERAERAGKALARSSGGGGATADDVGDDAAAGSVEDEMSRLTDHHRRKVKKRAAFLEKIRVATETKMKKNAKKGSGKMSVTDMKTLSLSLADIVGGAGSVKRTKTPTAKRRTALVSNETMRMQAVLSHPQYKANPIAAISNHILTGLAADAEARGNKPGANKPKRKKKLTPQQERELSGAHVVGPQETKPKTGDARAVRSHKHGGTKRGKLFRA